MLGLGVSGLTFSSCPASVGSGTIHLDVVGATLNILDSAEAASDFLEKLSSNYSIGVLWPCVQGAKI